MITSFKLLAVRLVVLAGGFGVFAWQFYSSLHRPTYGNAAFQNDWISETLRAVVTGGIPAIGAALAAHFLLTWLLFRHGEIEDFEAAQRVASTKRSLSSATVAAPPATRVAHSRFAEDLHGDTSG